MMHNNQQALSDAILRSVAILLAVVGAMLVLAPGLVLYAVAWMWPGGAQGTVAVVGTAPETNRFVESRPGSSADAAARFEAVDTADIAIDRVREGRSDAGIAPSIFLAASSGFEGVANLGWMYLHIIVPSGSEIHALRDLAGRRLGFGGGDPSIRVLLDRVFKYYGFAALPQTVEQHNADLEKAFLEGEIDAAAIMAGLFDETVTKLMATGWYELVPVPESDALAAWLPGAASVEFPAGVYGPERNRPDAVAPQIPTLAVARLLFTQAVAPETTVHALIKRLEALPPAEYAIVPFADRRNVSPLPLHDAAARIYSGVDSVSTDTPRGKARLIGVWALVLACGCVAAARIQTRMAARRRKVDTYLRGMNAQMQQIQSTLEALVSRWDQALVETESAPQPTTPVDGAAAPRESVSIFALPSAQELVNAPTGEGSVDDAIVGAARPYRVAKPHRPEMPAGAPEPAPDSDQLGLPF